MTAKDVEKALEACRVECLGRVREGDYASRIGWYYTFLGALELAHEVGAIGDDFYFQCRCSWYSEAYPTS